MSNRETGMAQLPASPKPSNGFHPLEDFQNAPRIPRLNLAESFIPIVGPAWQAAGDLQDGRYRAAAFNAGMAALEVLPIGEIAESVSAASRISKKFGSNPRSFVAIRNAMKKLKMTREGEQEHHIVPLQGDSRTAPNWKNNLAFLKALTEETHMRLHKKWGGQPKFTPVEQLLHGSPDWAPNTAAGLLGYVADGAENLTGPTDNPDPTSAPTEAVDVP
jgi:hypothetical protein